MGESHFNATILDIFRLARGHIHSRTRTPAYFERGDALADLFLGQPLGISSRHCATIGTDLAVVLDSCYESFIGRPLEGTARLREMTRRLARVVDASAASSALMSLRARLDAASCPLSDVASSLLAAITILGHEALLQRASAEVAREWLDLWGAAVRAHNDQQEVHTALSMLRATPPTAPRETAEMLGLTDILIPEPGGTFFSGAKRYLATFSATAASAMVLVGGLPFAEKLSAAGVVSLLGFLRSTPEFLTLMDEVLRFAQDVRFDPAEPISLGMFALAEEEGVGVLAVSRDRADSRRIEQRLKVTWELYHPQAFQRLDALQACLRTDDGLFPAMNELRRFLHLVAGMVAEVDGEGARRLTHAAPRLPGPPASIAVPGNGDMS